MTQELKDLINEKALISSLDHKDYDKLKRLKEIDLEIKQEINKVNLIK